MTLADRLLLAFVIPGIALFAYNTWQPSTQAKQVEIITPFEKKIVPLYANTSMMLAGALGKSKIDIDHHRARFSSSPCKTKFCIHQGWASHSGELRACLPNKISLRLIGQTSKFDSITF